MYCEMMQTTGKVRKITEFSCFYQSKVSTLKRPKAHPQYRKTCSVIN